MKRKKSRRQRVIPIIPNLLTTGSLFLGLISILTSIQIVSYAGYQEFADEWVYRKFWWAAAFLGFAIVLDLFDGKLARLLKSESEFGLSYDSLTDLVSFGVAPAVLVYVWSLMYAGKFGLMAVLFFVVCCALRLARFNLQSKTVEKNSFTGLPAPMAGGLMFSPILLFSEFKIAPNETMTWFYLVAAPFIGLLMVSNVPYLKYPKIKLAGPFNALVVSAIIIAAIVTNPEIMLISIVYIYSVIGLIRYVGKQLIKRPSAAKEVKTE
ncbi:phosphatidylcholine/phosphatidylserine synthase [Desulfobacterota bacterium AH_259_B03_O07]|nr:phosphatidylcholine/phosphatidylserine synthase [Desulfobacterota bacterium AH_259_B03_O07]